ncbi:iron-binding protein [Actinotalea ferrariae CF5-4]|uniref:Iron-binding protein n=1 Tax=Actinotalea ferrariae CF5-4 TaxID=948458 RepID=A0A021VNQ6_9CELL|nr:iron-binding protein [Actinotalea ferrariae CF5-4]
MSTDRRPDDVPAEPITDPRREPWASVTACPNGPLLVRGDVEILLADGEPAPRRRRTVALCRCGASAIKPYCDGSHKVIDFRTDDEPRTTGSEPPRAAGLRSA